MQDWHSVVLAPEATMEEAIRRLDQTALRMVMVADTDGRLLGTITDGDIRRALLKFQPMTTSVNDVMFATPSVASQEETRESIMTAMKARDLLHMPIVDTDGVLVGLETLQHLLSANRYDNPVFLMAGGFGKRLHPLTEHTPKPLLKVGQKPILETILDQFVAVGFHNFFISTHYKAEMVRDHFGDGSQWDVTIQYIHEESPLGTAGALGLLPKEQIVLPLVMMNGDLLTKVDFEHLLNFHNEHGSDATMCVREYDFQVPYGVIESDHHRVTNIVEQPVHIFFVNAGIYVLSPKILGQVDGTNYLDMPHMLETVIEQEGQVNMFPLHEYWLDIGQMEQFEKAQHDSAEIFL